MTQFTDATPFTGQALFTDAEMIDMFTVSDQLVDTDVIDERTREALIYDGDDLCTHLRRAKPKTKALTKDQQRAAQRAERKARVERLCTLVHGGAVTPIRYGLGWSVHGCITDLIDPPVYMDGGEISDDD